MSYPLLLIGIVVYILCMYYLGLVIGLVCIPINIYGQILRFKASNN
jgi:hypothetical protein